MLVLLLGVLVVMAVWGKPWLIVLVLFLAILVSAQDLMMPVILTDVQDQQEDESEKVVEDVASHEKVVEDVASHTSTRQPSQESTQEQEDASASPPGFIGPAGAPVEPMGGGAPPPLSVNSCDGNVAPAGGSAGFSAVDYAKASPAQSSMSVPLHAHVDAKPNYQQDLMDAAMAVSVTNLPLPSGKSIKEFAYFCNNDVCHHKDRYMVENKSAAPSHERAPPLAGPAGERHR